MTYLGPGGGYFAAFIVGTILLFVTTFALLGRMRASGVQLNVIRRLPVAAGVHGADFTRYRKAATPLAKTWSRAAIALAVLAAIASGPLNFLPAGNPGTEHGQYVEISHGTVLRILTRAQYETLNMRELRFAGTISALMLAGIATMLSGAIEIERQDRR